MRISSRINPVGGFQDFWQEFKKPNPYRWPILGASFLMTGGLLYSFTQERVYVPPEPPKVSYIKTLPMDRTDEEIMASNIDNQKVMDELEAERARIEEEVKQGYRDLGRATGIDVDAMEAEIEAEREAEEAARERAARAQRLEQQQSAGATGDNEGA